MLFADLALARRLEAAEGFACAQFALARHHLFPGSGSEAIRIAGADVVYDGPDSPVTQTFGLGLFAEAANDALDQIEAFFTTRGAHVHHEVSPFAGIDTLQKLCSRGYHPIELSSVLYQPIVDPTIVGAPDPSHLGTREGSSPSNSQGVVVPGSPVPSVPVPSVRIRLIGPQESILWSEINARGWAHDHPEFEPFMRDIGALLTSREGSACFLAEIDGVHAATGALSIHQGVALFSGAATLPEHRRRGLQSALLEARMTHAREQGCDLAMMVAEIGSNSQRNAERQGFQIAYTRINWQRTASSS